jgi:hypothetical protein
MVIKVKIKYTETKADREIGLKYFNEINNIYGSRSLWLSLAIATGIIAVLEIMYKIHIIGIGCLGIIVSLVAIWLLGIKRYLVTKKFKIDNDILYELDFEKNTITLKDKDYYIRSYYDFNDGFLVEHEKGYLFLNRVKLDVDIQKKLNINKDK